MKKEIVLLTPIAICIVIAVIILALYNYRIKKRIIDAGPIDEYALKYLMSMSGVGSEVLKWGLILFFGGLGLIIIEFVPFDAEESSVPYGIETVFIALGFLIYYFIMKQQKS